MGVSRGLWAVAPFLFLAPVWIPPKKRQDGGHRAGESGLESFWGMAGSVGQNYRGSLMSWSPCAKTRIAIRWLPFSMGRLSRHAPGSG